MAYLQVREGKGGKTRTLPCSDELLTDLKHLIGPRKSGPVFMSSHTRPFVLSQINNIVAKAGRLAGLTHPDPRYKNINPHLLRHTFARLWKDSGQSIESLSKILGHTSIKTTLDEYGTEDLQTVQSNDNQVMAQVF